jgi:hypothetical protein
MTEPFITYKLPAPMHHIALNVSEGLIYLQPLHPGQYSGTLVHKFNSFLEAVHHLKRSWTETIFCPIVSYLIIYKKPQNTMKFKRRHSEFEQGCVLRESYTATDALLPILPACRQLLLMACVFVTRDTVCQPRCLFFFSRKICSWTDLFVMRGIHEQRFHCSWDFNPRVTYIT